MRNTSSQQFIYYGDMSFPKLVHKKNQHRTLLSVPSLTPRLVQNKISSAIASVPSILFWLV